MFCYFMSFICFIIHCFYSFIHLFNYLDVHSSINALKADRERERERERSPGRRRGPYRHALPDLASAGFGQGGESIGPASSSLFWCQLLGLLWLLCCFPCFLGVMLGLFGSLILFSPAFFASFVAGSLMVFPCCCFVVFCCFVSFR